MMYLVFNMMEYEIFGTCSSRTECALWEGGKGNMGVR